MSRDSQVTLSRQSLRRGFTLLELIIVLVVLAALAALVIPTLGFVRDQANHATGAAGAAEVLNNLETYKAATGAYPSRMDSLAIDGDGTIYGKIASGGGIGRLSSASEAGTIAYFMKNGGGIASLVNHVPNATNTEDPNTSTQTSPIFDVYTTEEVANPDYDSEDPESPETIEQSAARFLIVDPTSSTLWATTPRIVRAAYPNQTNAASPQIPTGHYLVAVGVGERSSCVGTTMTSAPVWAGAPADTYGRYIAFFDVSAGPSGRGKVQLKLVTDPTFNTIARSTQLYQQSTPTDDQGGE